jgi:hypothetical protein
MQIIILNNLLLVNQRKIPKKSKEKIMSKERILPYKMAKKISQEELQEISAAGWTNSVCGQGTYSRETGWDAGTDVHLDY